MLATPLTTLESTATVDAVCSIMERDGTLSIRNLATADQMDRVLADLAPYIAKTPRGKDKFSGLNTTRTGNLFGRSPSCADLVLNPLVSDVAERVLLPHEGIQIGETSAMRIGPGAAAQTLHRDDGNMRWIHPGPDCLLTVVFAASDFRKDNGATWVVPGSHRWGEDAEPSREQAVQAEMPKGSVLMWVGSLYHGAGANLSDEFRTALLFDFRLGNLRQTENQYLAVPREVVKGFPERLQRLLGYSLYGRFLGYIGGWEEDPITYLRD